MPTRIATILSDYFYDLFHSSSEANLPSSVRLTAISRFLDKVGVQEGSTLMVHSSWEQLNSGNFSVSDLIKALLNSVGSSGTLAMPAFAHSENQFTRAVFDVRRTPSSGGLVTEAFRRFPNVKRSIHLNHSVCSIGGNANYLTRDHHRSETSWDEFSPYYRLRNIDDAWIVGLGVGHRLKVATSLHCVESILWKKNRYFKKIFKEKINYLYKNDEGDFGQHSFMERHGEIYTPKLAKYFSSDELIEEVIEGLEVYAIRARILVDKAINLGRKGKTMYIWPIPFKRYFDL